MAIKNDTVTNGDILQRGYCRRHVSELAIFYFYSPSRCMGDIYLPAGALLRGYRIVVRHGLCFGCWRIWLNKRYFVLITHE